MTHDLAADVRWTDGRRSPPDAALTSATPSVVVDRAGVIIDVDPGVSDVLMIPPGDLLGHAFVDHVWASDRRRVKECFQSCLGFRVHAIAEVQLVRRDGSLTLAQLASYPKWEGAANVIGCRIQIHDISALKRAQARLALVAEASAVLGGPLTQPLRLDRVAALLVPTLADACLIDVVVAKDQLRRAAAFIGGELPDLAAAMPGEGSIVTAASPQGRVLTLGEPLVNPSVNPPGSHHPVCLPMRVESQSCGVLTLITRPDRALSQADLEVARDLGGRIAQALQNRQAHERLQRALRDRDDGPATRARTPQPFLETSPDRVGADR